MPSNAGLVDTHISYPIANVFSEPLHHLGVTPNQVTTLTLAIRCIATYLLYKRQHRTLAFCLFLTSWFTDALDGLMARKYNMKSEFGAHYDYIVDVFTTLILLLTLYFRYYNTAKFKFMLLLVTLAAVQVALVMKVRHKQPENPKPWEKWIMKIPVDTESNIVQHVDPGLTYVVKLIGIYYALFVLKH